MTNDFRRCIETCDVVGMQALWARVSPHLPQPNEEHALVAIHMARTQTSSIKLGLRIYSHRWLTERGLPSQLPDDLKPAPEQINPRIVQAVGISVNFLAPELLPASKMIERAMSDAVADCFANGDTDPALVSRRMAEAQRIERRALFGSIGKVS